MCMKAVWASVSPGCSLTFVGVCQEGWTHPGTGRGSVILQLAYEVEGGCAVLRPVVGVGFNASLALGVAAVARGAARELADSLKCSLRDAL